MVNENRQTAPYAPVDNVLRVIHRLRERGLPELLSFGALQSIGIPAGNAPRTLAALRFLGLVGEEDQRTDRMEQLRRATTDQYQEVLAHILRDAYEPIFTLVDPATHNEMDVHDAFRQYEPQAQRRRMVTLFLGLCREAGIAPGGPPERRSRRRRQAIRVEPATVQARAEPATIGVGLHEEPQQETGGTDYRLISALMQQLPKSGKWTKERRDKWIQAVSAGIDLLIEIQEGGDSGDG